MMTRYQFSNKWSVSEMKEKPSLLREVRYYQEDIRDGLLYHFRGPQCDIEELLNRCRLEKWMVNADSGMLKPGDAYKKKLKKLPEGIQEIWAEIPHREVLNVVKQYPSLKCAALITGYGVVYEAYSESGYPFFTHKKLVGCFDTEGESWIHYYSVMTPVHLTESLDGDEEEIDYRFSLEDDWNLHEYLYQENGKWYSAFLVGEQQHVLLKGKDAGEIVSIPSRYRELGPKCYARNKKMTQLFIPEGVTTIGERAFEECTKLVEVHLPESLTTIGDAAFWGCTKLKAVHLPDNAVHLGKYIFDGCSSLTEARLPDGVERIPEGMFLVCSKLKKIELPDSVTVVDKDAFSGCEKLSSITFSKNLTTIADEAFLGCSALQNKKGFKLPDTLETLGDKAFGDIVSSATSCYAQITIRTLPSKLKAIGKYALSFAFDESVSEITLSSVVEEVGRQAFHYNPFQRLRIEPGIRVLSQGVFRGCPDLWRVEIEGNLLKRIEKGAFSGCTSLLYLIVPDETELDEQAVDPSCQIVRRKEVPTDPAMLKELDALRNGNCSADSFATRYPFAFLLSDVILSREADALQALLCHGIMMDDKLMKRYWKAASFASIPAKQAAKLQLLKKNWKNIISLQNDLTALAQYLNTILS